MEKLIISAAICGAEVTKEQNPAVPYTVEEIAREAKSAYDAGASVIHLHVRWDDGTPTQDKGRFQECVDAIRALCPEAIIQPSTGGAVGMSDLERLQSTEIEPTPEFATLDCGTCNFGGDEIFVNTDNTVMNFAKIMAERGIKPELEVFDKGMIDIALKADRKGLLKHPLHFDFVLGVQMSATVRDLVFMAESVPAGSTWTATGLGKTPGPSRRRQSAWAAMYAWALRTICIWKRAFWRRATERWWKKWQRWPACWAAPSPRLPRPEKFCTSERPKICE